MLLMGSLRYRSASNVITSNVDNLDIAYALCTSLKPDYGLPSSCTPKRRAKEQTSRRKDRFIDVRYKVEMGAAFIGVVARKGCCWRGKPQWVQLALATHAKVVRAPIRQPPTDYFPVAMAPVNMGKPPKTNSQPRIFRVQRQSRNHHRSLLDPFRF